MLDKPEVGQAKKEMLRDFANEQLGFIRLQAELAQMQIEVGDDLGLVYATKRLVAHARAMAATVRDLQALLVREKIVAEGFQPEEQG